VSVQVISLYSTGPCYQGLMHRSETF